MANGSVGYTEEKHVFLPEVGHAPLYLYLSLASMAVSLHVGADNVDDTVIRSWRNACHHNPSFTVPYLQTISDSHDRCTHSHGACGCNSG